MQEILDEIERAAERCKVAASNLKESFLRVSAAQDPVKEIEAFFLGLLATDDPTKKAAPLVMPAREAVQVFDDFRERIVPRLDAILGSEQEDVRVWVKHRSVQSVARTYNPSTIKLTLFGQLSEQTKPSGHPSDLRMISAINSLADVFCGCIIAMMALPEVGEDLAYIAGYLKTKRAMEAHRSELSESHGGEIAAGGKHASRSTSSLVRDDKRIDVIKILFLGANPASTTRLALDKEVREITHKLRAATHGQQFEVVQEWAVRLSDLQAGLLRHRPQILHFSGHGSEDGEIVVENEAGAAVTIRPEALSNLFKILKKNIRCVVLNACYSEAQAEAIAQHIECVVGMTTAVGDTGAIAFAWSFYQALGFNSSVQEAFDLGCNQVDLAGLRDTDTPKLVARGGVRPEEVYLLGQDAAAGDGNPRDLAPAQQGVSSFTINVSGGTHGAIAVGPGAKAEGSVNLGDLGTGRGKPRS